MNDLAKQLIGFTTHDPYCHGKYDGTINTFCTCGLSRIVAEIREADRHQNFQPAHARQQQYYQSGA